MTLLLYSNPNSSLVPLTLCWFKFDQRQHDVERSSKSQNYQSWQNHDKLNMIQAKI